MVEENSAVTWESPENFHEYWMERVMTLFEGFIALYHFQELLLCSEGWHLLSHCET